MYPHILPPSIVGYILYSMLKTLHNIFINTLCYIISNIVQ